MIVSTMPWRFDTELLLRVIGLRARRVAAMRDGGYGYYSRGMETNL